MVFCCQVLFSAQMLNNHTYNSLTVCTYKGTSIVCPSVTSSQHPQSCFKQILVAAPPPLPTQRHATESITSISDSNADTGLSVAHNLEVADGVRDGWAYWESGICFVFAPKNWEVSSALQSAVCLHLAQPAGERNWRLDSLMFRTGIFKGLCNKNSQSHLNWTTRGEMALRVGAHSWHAEPKTWPSVLSKIPKEGLQKLLLWE